MRLLRPPGGATGVGRLPERGTDCSESSIEAGAAHATESESRRSLSAD
jgi:hypothetical protein